MRTNALVGVLTLSLLSAAAAQRISASYDPAHSFAHYHTYAWGAASRNQIANPILDREATRDVDAALQTIGLRMVREDQDPDLIVTASGGAEGQTSYRVWETRGGLDQMTPAQSVASTLVVRLYDPRTKSLVWRGIAEHTLNSNGNKNQKLVQNAVNKMFKQWPKS